MRGLIFDDLPSYATGTISHPRLDYAYEGQVRNLTKVMDFHKTSGRSVSNKNLISSILTHIESTWHENPVIMYNMARELTMEWAAAFKITTPAKACAPLLGELLGGTDLEFLYSVEAPIQKYKFSNGRVANWEELTPIQVVRHPYSDSAFWLPGDAPKDKAGVVVVTIDLTMLLMMYHSWRGEEPKDSLRTKRDFIASYILPKMLESMDVVKNFNRYLALVARESYDTTQPLKYIATVNYASKLVQEQGSQVKEWEFRKAEWPWLLQNVRLNHKTTIAKLLTPLPGVETQQNRWIKVLAQADAWKLLIAMDKLTPSSTNQQYRNRMQRILKEIKRDRTVNSLKDPYAEKLISKEFDEIASLIKAKK